jgi:hypothetical protein
VKTFVATVEVELTCTDEQIFRDHLIGIPFGDHDCGFRIVSIKQGKIPRDQDETLLPKYRKLHGCSPLIPTGDS